MNQIEVLESMAELFAIMEPEEIADAYNSIRVKCCRYTKFRLKYVEGSTNKGETQWEWVKTGAKNETDQDKGGPNPTSQTD